MPKLVILTGAGLSAESGVSTFRDSNGLWENHRIEEVCYIDTWRQNFELVHKFYNARRTQLGIVEPNAAHRMIVEWEQRYDTVSFTQNVDDLLERAGSKSVVHLHGFLPELRCLNCGNIWNVGYTAWDTKAICPTSACGDRGLVKPNIVFFGEAAPLYAKMWDTFESMTKDDVLLILGTSGVVLPVTDIAQAHRGPSILNNLHHESAIRENAFDHVIYDPATQAVQKIDALLKKYLG